MKKKVYRDKAMMKKRSSFALIVLLTFLCGLALRLSYIMIVERKEYAAGAEEQWTSEVQIDARRGKILDRNGVELAVSANVYRIDFDLNSIRKSLEKDKKTTDDIAPLIAEATGIPTAEVKDKLETKLPSGKDAGSATLVRRVEKSVADKVNALDIYGVIVSADTKRYYPNDTLASHVLGSTNIDGVGLTGAELQYNEYLAGIPGRRITELDKGNEELPYTISKFTPPVDGKDLKLTIDENLQYFAEKTAEKGMIDNNAKAVSVLIMNPKTGEVLAMANKPDFDPNDPFKGYEAFEGETNSDKLQKMWRNRLVNDTFEPGSVFKVVTMSAALEEGVVHENDTFTCGGSLVVGGRTIKCWKTGGHGTQTLPEIVQNSCNVGFMEVGKRLGAEKLNEYIRAFGFGKVSGIDLPGEARGIIKATKDITETDLATISFGQTNTVNSVQYMTAFNALANGGTLIQPHVMKEVSHLDENGTVVIDEKFNPQKSSNVVSAETAATLRDYLERTVVKGGSSKSYIEGYNIGAKTGTAQKVINGVYAPGKYISSVAAMAPVDDPEITVFISIDEPSNGAYYAGQIAAPLAKELFDEIFNYLESEFAKEGLEGIEKEIVIPEVRGLSVDKAKQILKDHNLTYRIEGSGSIITDIKPYPGYTVKEGSEVTLYTDGNGTSNKNVIMPNLKGRSVEDVDKLLGNLGIKYSIEGKGAIIKQSIPAGELVNKGSTVNLILNDEY